MANVDAPEFMRGGAAGAKRAYKVAATLKEKNGINLELVTVRELLDSNPEVDT